MGYQRGKHPNSQQNLRRSGTKPRYEEKKRHRVVMVTDTGWKGAFQVAKVDLGVSRSEMVELIGRRQIQVIEVEDSSPQHEDLTNSQISLNRPGTKPRYEERKCQRSVLATDTGWKGALEVARAELGTSLSEMVELIGRKKLRAIKVEEDMAI